MARVLVVDDDRVNRLLLCRFLTLSQHEVAEAGSGEAAVEMFEDFAPDVVLLDVVMPGMDGFETTERLKRLSGRRYVPIILLTALTDEQSLARGISAGADDFISKPINQTVLNSRLYASLRSRRLFARLESRNAELRRHQEREQRELQLAERLLSNMIQSHALSDPRLRCHSRPFTLFNGDLLLAHHTPSGRLRVMLGDFAGHGLHAAIGSMPVAVMFQRLTDDGRDVRSMLEQINDHLVASLPTELFLAAGVVELAVDGRSIEVWNCGMPEMLLASPGSVTRCFASHAMPLGIMRWDHGASGASADVAPGDRVYLFSDGLLEVRGPEDEEFGLHRVVRELERGQNSEVGFDALLEARSDFMGEGSENDDVTIVQIAAEARDAEASVAARARSRVTVELGPDELRALDCGRIVENIVASLPLAEEDRSHVGTIVAELVANGLDHGILGLESSLKADPGGFESYHARREEALRSLARGQLVIELALSKESARTRVAIQVRDSGPGFDGSRGPTADREGAAVPWGRGLAIVDELSERLSILGRGNVVEAEYLALPSEPLLASR